MSAKYWLFIRAIVFLISLIWCTERLFNESFKSIHFLLMLGLKFSTGALLFWSGYTQSTRQMRDHAPWEAFPKSIGILPWRVCAQILCHLFSSSSTQRAFPPPLCLAPKHHYCQVRINIHNLDWWWNNNDKTKTTKGSGCVNFSPSSFGVSHGATSCYLLPIVTYLSRNILIPIFTH